MTNASSLCIEANIETLQKSPETASPKFNNIYEGDWFGIRGDSLRHCLLEVRAIGIIARAD